MGSVFLALAGVANAGSEPLSSVTLAWDPSPDSSVTGYNIYVGGASRDYTNRIDVGNTNLAVVPGLQPGATYYFAATAYDAIGLESGFSSEVSYTVPSTAAIDLVVVPGKPIRLSGLAPAAYTYEVQTSVDLTNWTSLGTVTTDSAGRLAFTNATSSTNAFRCFRLRQTWP